MLSGETGSTVEELLHAEPSLEGILAPGCTRGLRIMSWSSSKGSYEEFISHDRATGEVRSMYPGSTSAVPAATSTTRPRPIFPAADAHFGFAGSSTGSSSSASRCSFSFEPLRDALRDMRCPSSGQDEATDVALVETVCVVNRDESAKDDRDEFRLCVGVG